MINGNDTINEALLKAKAKKVYLEGNFVKIIKGSLDKDVVTYIEECKTKDRLARKKRLDVTKQVQAQNKELEEAATVNKALVIELQNEKDEAEKLREVDKLKSHFFANISHEFRTPLTLIKGPIKQMLNSEKRQNIKKQYKMVIRNSDRLLGLINQILDLSKLESGEIKLKVTETDIIQYLKGMVLSFSSWAERKKVTLRFTPIENSLIDLWSQVSFLNPGLLGNLTFFKKEFLYPIEKKNSKTHEQRLKKLIQPFILRRTKKDVEKELPDLMENIRYIEMTEEHKKVYERKKSEIRNLIFRDLENVRLERKMVAVLKGLTQLRLIANHPVLLDEKYNSDSGKFDEVIRMMDDIIAENHKVLVYSSFVKHLKIFSRYFENESIKYNFLSGDIIRSKRKAIIEDFQKNNDNKVFLISIKAGGVGLNLTAADYVFILDPWWNPAVEAQAINRAHRIGQDKKVFSYKFITKNTVEEKIVGLQQRKKLLANEFIEFSNPLKALSAEDIENLFG